jgi:hypothetical protein
VSSRGSLQVHEMVPTGGVATHGVLPNTMMAWRLLACVVVMGARAQLPRAGLEQARRSHQNKGDARWLFVIRLVWTSSCVPTP